MTLPRPEEFTHHRKWLQRAFDQQPDAIGAANLRLWEHLARELMSIIGEAGFESLYSRCVFLLRDEYPWLQLHPPSAPIGTRFDALKTQLDQQEFALAERASRALLDTFMRLLSGLIGVGLTQNILQVAWDRILPEPNQENTGSETDDRKLQNDSPSIEP
ncbi:hypothetical protein [Undibacterium sp. Ji22W]|uniref:hypothetical protein n=1 Tax=Undibacterium sp. Ji22W TaxID=3413038 RepID=UPI003BF1C80F